MTCRTLPAVLALLALVLLAPVLLSPAAGRAATIERSLSDWNAARNGAPYLTTSVVDPGVTFLNEGTVPVSAFTLANGTGVTLSGTGDYTYISGFGGPQYGDGYTGQLVDSTNGTDTLTFSAPLSAFALTVKPDDAGLPPTTDTLTVSLSDGTTGSVTASFGLSTVQFIGYTGAPVRSVTISTASGNDFFLGEFLTPTAAAAVPEPATLALLAAGLAGLGATRRRASR